ncbi:gluconokinase [Nocardioides limicola]|uniref:gluconokinase n=1 Tax=Nocardioides limicola TaxID=2803368 RepID=UPI00193B15A6|nr:gluconokinase [Nocardioides sp. DJM-14]
MGVSGTGKSTVAQGLAATLGLVLAEGDDFHPDANIEKMSAGIPLTDSDRLPWLRALAEWTAARDAEGVSTVLTCSALRVPYRDILRSATPGRPTYFVHLVGSPDVLSSRMESREHFMPTSLLESQIATLESLRDDEDGLVVDVDAPLEQVTARAVAWLTRL